MVERDTELAMFIDYDNLLQPQKQAGILDTVRRALFGLPVQGLSRRTKCTVRIYGGWYEGTQITRLAQDITVEIQRDFPAVIRVPVDSSGSTFSVSTTAELAVALLQEPGHHMFNTYRRKGKPANVRVTAPCDVGCVESDCVLPLMKKLLRNGTCPKAGCRITTTDHLVYRHEQKIVDTLLCCDLIHAGRSPMDRVILLSGDDDFLPALRTVLLGGLSAVRYHPKPNGPRASFPQGGVQLLELEL